MFFYCCLIDIFCVKLNKSPFNIKRLYSTKDHIIQTRDCEHNIKSAYDLNERQNWSVENEQDTSTRSE